MGYYTNSLVMKKIGKKNGVKLSPDGTLTRIIDHLNRISGKIQPAITLNKLDLTPSREIDFALPNDDPKR
jgi:hypothetical protein